MAFGDGVKTRQSLRKSSPCSINLYFKCLLDIDTYLRIILTYLHNIHEFIINIK